MLHDVGSQGYRPGLLRLIPRKLPELVVAAAEEQHSEAALRAARHHPIAQLTVPLRPNRPASELLLWAKTLAA